MADMLDKAIALGMGLEKKLKELVDELEKKTDEALKSRTAGAGEASAGEKPLTTRQAIENRVVEEGVLAVKELLTIMKSARDKVEGEVVESKDKMLERLNIASKDDLEVIKEMARVAREKTDELEKRVKDIEQRLGE